MLQLRMDPWDARYGMGYDAWADEEADETADTAVESDDWSTPLSPATGPWAGPVRFVDGVERVELGLIAEDDGRHATGLFGSFAVGDVHVNGRATFGESAVDRALVTGGGLRGEALTLPIGRATLHFRPVTDEHTDPDRPRRRLLATMRQAEAARARSLAGEPDTLVLADGRLAFPDESGLAIVGFVKRFMKHHLPVEQGALLGSLDRGQRTPLFVLVGREDDIQRYSWYVRLVPLQRHWHGYAGLVRCEVSAGIGRDTAIALADRVTALLPRFAGSANDPRTPQNLAPVARLESQLRRFMGDARLIRRELVSWLMRHGGEK